MAIPLKEEASSGGLDSWFLTFCVAFATFPFHKNMKFIPFASLLLTLTLLLSANAAPLPQGEKPRDSLDASNDSRDTNPDPWCQRFGCM